MERPLESDVEEAHLSSNPVEGVLARLERATEYFRREIHLVLRARGMTSTQYNVLRTLYDAEPGGITCSELGSRLESGLIFLIRISHGWHQEPSFDETANHLKLNDVVACLR